MEAGRGGLIVLLVGCLVLAGCTNLVDPNPGAPNQTPEQDEEGEEGREDCQTRRFSANATGGQGQMAWIECYAEVPGRNAQEISCPKPGDAELQVKADLTRGRIQVAVEDAAGIELVNESIEQTPEEGRNVTMNTDDAEPGTWTLTATRSDPFEGSFDAKLWCPQ